MTKKKPESAAIVFDTRNVPISTRFDDPYFSFQDGVAESEYVFLCGNDLNARFLQTDHDKFTIAELGFGTGLNFLLTWRLWRDIGTKAHLEYISFEKYPMQLDDLRKSLRQFPELNVFSESFIQGFQNDRFTDDNISLRVVYGDVNETLSAVNFFADAWYLDGFSPAKNPEMWNEALLTMVGLRTRQNGTFATYSAAGHVRRNLVSAGFDVIRKKGFGHKRHMLKGIKH